MLKNKTVVCDSPNSEQLRFDNVRKSIILNLQKAYLPPVGESSPLRLCTAEIAWFNLNLWWFLVTLLFSCKISISCAVRLLFVHLSPELSNSNCVIHITPQLMLTFVMYVVRFVLNWINRYIPQYNDTKHTSQTSTVSLVRTIIIQTAQTLRSITLLLSADVLIPYLPCRQKAGT